MTFMPPKVGTVQEEFWIHRSDGTVVRASMGWLKDYLANNPGLLNELGYARKSERKPDPMPLPLYRAPATAHAPIPPGKSGQPAWLTAPSNPNAGKAAAVVAGELCDLTVQKKANERETARLRRYRKR